MSKIKLKKESSKLTSLLTALLLVTPFSLVGVQKEAKAVGTPAGTVIGNQATATYEDSQNNSYTSTSNLVTTTVTAVYGFTITPNGTEASPGQQQNATPGGIVYYPYTLTNNGNATDSFTISSVVGSTTTPSLVTGVNSSKEVYLDVNGNGIVDVGDTLIPNGGSVNNVPADTQVKLIVKYQVPSSASSGNVITVDLQGTSVGNNTVTDTNNYNKTTVVNDAVISVSKTVDLANVDPNGDLTYTFTITNTGNQTANNVEFIDQIPANTDFIVASQSGVGTFSFSNDGGTTYTYTPTGTTDANVTHVRWQLPSLAPANTRVVSFKVRVEATAPNVVVPNSANFSYDDNDINTPKITGTTNTVNSQINRKSAVLLTFSSTPFGAQTTTGTDAATTDATVQASTPAGTYLYFKNVVKNKGNATDLFNITVDSNTFPAGSTVSFFQLTDPSVGANNVNPLLDTNGDSIPDTGNILRDDPNTPAVDEGEFTFVTRVFVPTNASGGPFNAVVRATSTNGGTAIGTNPGQTLSDTTRNRLTSVIVPDVNLENIINGSASTNDDDTPVSLTASANGTTVSYPIQIQNKGGSPDTFNLTSSTTISGATILFYPVLTTTTLASAASAGATSVDLTNATGFTAGDNIIINGQTLTVGSVAGNTVTFAAGQSLFASVAAGATVLERGNLNVSDTGVINAGASANFVAVVNVPSGVAPNSYPVNITSTSTNDNTKFDTVSDTLIVPAFRTFTLVANRSGSAPAGGVLFYDHTLTNTGNTTETYNLSASAGTNGFTYQVMDTSNNIITTTTPLAPGASFNFKIKVIIPSGTPSGTVDSTVVTGQVGSNTQTNTDTTTVVSGFISLTKSVVNKGPSGTNNDPGTTGKPGDILEYRIQYENIGSADALNCVITDLIPANTTYVSGSLQYDPDITDNGGVFNGAAVTDASGDDAGEFLTNQVRFYVGGANTATTGGTVNPAERGEVRFRVQIN
ncbi:MAG: hypothetical protein KatS3mg068_1055 [Candidatus Sericytochromatia bacterium]|nr:MAG: hypothetical protein KatS3mg068_1055 [Candidatus Sericytochromatia bacterium]